MTLDDLFDLLATKGHALYGGERVTQLAHALQCAQLAEENGAPPSLITAALFHDIGHLVTDDEGGAARGEDFVHEEAGAAALTALFGPDVTEPVHLHVPAKRYLCAIDHTYWDGLSEASRQSLAVQGGPFSDAEVEAFAAHPFAQEAVDLRRWDDLAKALDRPTPDLSHYRAAAAASLAQ